MNLTTATLLHEGPNSLVYYHAESEFGKPVIVKILRAVRPSHQQVAHFTNEYELTKRISHPGIRSGLAKTKVGGRHALVLDYIDGETVRDYFIKHQVPLADFLRIAIAIAESLDVIHQLQIIHKDINSRNILIGHATQQPVIIDFGIAAQLDLKSSHLKWALFENGSSGKRRNYRFQTNRTVGNPEQLGGSLSYISPEQTGRMNRAVDHRTDLYSLGVTLYELLTGQLPFQQHDPLALVHAHLTIEAPSITERDPQLPRILAQIVARLLAKNAEDRYQSAAGLAADLCLCLEHLGEDGSIEPFPLGSQDVSAQFKLPQRLYGRDAERETLLAAFEESATNGTQLVLIAGHSGAGKTALVHEIHTPITTRRGYFVSGKFEQYQRDVPYIGIVAAMQEMVRYLLTEPEEQLAEWRSQILSAVGSNAALLTRLIPELELVIGVQPEVETSGAQELQNRLQLAFSKLIERFAQPSHPLVLFLDDLQWADLASLRLLKQLLVGEQSLALLVIGAYRDNEVDMLHPLTTLVKAVGEASVVPHQLTLAPLTRIDVERYLTDLIKPRTATEQAQIPAFAALVHQRTDGNPFYLQEFMTAIHEAGLINFADAARAWQWDLAAIHAMGSTATVGELLATRLRRLPLPSQRLLQLAACIGHQFPFDLLQMIAEEPAPLVNQALLPAIQAGLIIPLNTYYLYADQFMDDPNQPGSHDSANEQHLYQFAHDRVQQAADALIAEPEKARIHWHIGQLLHGTLSATAHREMLFEIVGHLNWAAGTHLLGEEMREELMDLNISAGEKALEAAAFEAALRYLKTAYILLTNEDRATIELVWRDRYATALTLYTLMTKAAYYAGDTDSMQQASDAVIANGRSIWDKMPVATILLDSYITSFQYERAKQWGHQILEEAGIQLPQRFRAFATARKLIGTSWRLRRATALQPYHPGSVHDYKRLLALPEMRDPHMVLMMQFLYRLVEVAFLVDETLLAWLICLQIEISLIYGNSLSSISAYGDFAGLLVILSKRPQKARKLAETAIELANKANHKEMLGSALYRAHTFAFHWTAPVRQAIHALLHASQLSLEAGDIRTTGNAFGVYAMTILNWGVPLQQVQLECTRMHTLGETYQQQNLKIYLAIIHQTALNLLGESDDPCLLQGSAYGEAEIQLTQNAQIDRIAMISYLFHTAELCYFHGRYGEALTHLQTAASLRNMQSGLSTAPMINFYRAAVRLALYPTVSWVKQQRFLRAVQKDLQQLKQVARLAPFNYAHFCHLLSAERAKVLNKSALAIDHYNRAIALCKEHEYLNFEALALELAGRFADETGQHWLAQTYMVDALAAYQRWGAVSKVRDLQTRYPHLLTPKATELGELMPQAETFPTQQKRVGTTTESTSTVGRLDMGSILKASQAIAGEIVIEKLLTKMMQIVLESVGAQRVVLAVNGHGGWQIQAEFDQTDAQTATLHTIPLVDGKALVPITLLNYVIRTEESLILDRGDDEYARFAANPYFAAKAPAALLCMPLINQGKITGLVYLENYLSSGLFVEERMVILNLLSAQMAISLNNALLYEHLEERVQVRTSELTETLDKLQVTQNELLDAKERAEQATLAKSTFLSQMTHELRTPMNGVLGMATLLADTGLSTEQQQMLNTIRASGDTLLTIINDILDFSKIEANKLELEQVSFNIDQCIKMVFEIVGVTAKGKGLLLSHQIAPDVPPNIVQDVTRVRQILTNLVSNALKFTETGGIDINVSATPALTSNNLTSNNLTSNTNEEHQQEPLQPFTIHFSVKDSGIGIPANRIDTLFDSFSQVDASTTRKYGGTGLGLTISKQLSELMGGNMWVESEVGVGSTFFFTIEATAALVDPQEVHGSEKTEMIEMATTAAAQSQQQLHILLAEDNAVNQLVARGFLQKFGHTVDIVSNGLEALAALRQRRYDVILMDVHMPEMDGVTATKQIRTEWPADQQPPIIVLTADAMEQQKSEYLDAGMDDYVSKPIQIEELRAALTRVIETRVY